MHGSEGYGRIIGKSFVIRIQLQIFQSISEIVIGLQQTAPATLALTYPAGVMCTLDLWVGGSGNSPELVSAFTVMFGVGGASLVPAVKVDVAADWLIIFVLVDVIENTLPANKLSVQSHKDKKVQLKMRMLTMIIVLVEC